MLKSDGIKFTKSFIWI